MKSIKIFLLFEDLEFETLVKLAKESNTSLEALLADVIKTFIKNRTEIPSFIDDVIEKSKKWGKDNGEPV